jgi:hypothetical protein
MKTIKKELKRYDRLIKRASEISICDMTGFLERLRRDREMVASTIGKNINNNR